MNEKGIKFLVLDVDGVLTDGTIAIKYDQSVSKRFAVQDGCAIKLWQKAGGAVAILSGRNDEAVRHRASELSIKHVSLGVKDKQSGLDRLYESTGFSREVTAYVGDDLPDMAPMQSVEFPVAVANAAPDVKRVAGYVTRQRGGEGAVAEVIERLLRKNGSWTQMLRGVET